MKTTIYIACTLCVLIFCQQHLWGQTINVIPEPRQINMLQGNVNFDGGSAISIQGFDENDIAIKWLRERFTKAAGIALSARADADATIFLVKKPVTIGTSESYELNAADGKVLIAAPDNAGLFYGIQTLLQLLPPQIESNTLQRGIKWQIPSVQIADAPQFGYRGLMLDVARHFFTKQQVMQFIDNMVKYKYNRLHLHLTDDQGWRIEIKSLPKLTEVGAYRAPRQGYWGEWSKPSPTEPKTYGGFYTQDDMREIIKYAADRHVQILPEVDVPGHSLALVAAFPELSATPGKYAVNAGERFMIWPATGHFYGLLDNNVNPASEKTYEVLDKVFGELAQLFPYEYIHVGGDETYKGFWEKSAEIKKLMAREKLKNMDEVQSYFVKRVGKIIASKGKKMIGWDEIMEGGLAEGAAVMSWQGEKGGIAAAKMQHKVVMSPNTYTYVDLYQGDPVAEPPTYSKVLLEKSYQFNPLPNGVDPQYILGGQANLWSERLNTMRHAEYMLWPRGWAVAESVWSPQEKKNWNRFIEKTEAHFVRSDFAKTKYSRSMYDPVFGTSISNGDTLITLRTQIDGLKIHYAFDESFPDEFYPVYTAPLKVPSGARDLHVITSRDGVIVGKMIRMPIATAYKRK